jgi:hypothetical protein
MSTNLTPHEIETDLRKFTGTENYYRHWMRKIIFTDGIKAMADMCNAYWLIDLIASYQTADLMKKCEGFQIWILKRIADPEIPGRFGFEATCWKDVGNNNKPKVTQIGEYTDFPLDEIRIYVAPGGPNGEIVAFLTSEY